MYYGDKVILGALEKRDIDPIYELFNDLELRNYLSNSVFVTYDEEENWVLSASEAKKKGNYRMAIRNLNDEFLGTCGIVTHQFYQRSGTVGISILKKKYWGKGFGTDAMTVLISLGFLILNLHRIDLEVHEFNTRAIQSYKKVGFKTIGTKREAHFINGKYVNSIMMDFLRTEFDEIYTNVDLSKPSPWEINLQ